MLAWLHQALASERELLEGTVGKANEANAPETPRGGSAAATPTALTAASAAEGASEEFNLEAALHKVAEGTTRPLRLRVEQLLAAQPGPLVTFRLSHVLHFYAHVLARLLGPTNCLVVTITE